MSKPWLYASLALVTLLGTATVFSLNSHRPEPSFAGCEADDCWPVHIVGARGSGADGVDVADISGNGYDDIVSGSEESGHITLYLNPGPGVGANTAWRAIDISAGLPMRGIEDAAFVDLNGDGIVDAVLSSVEGRVQRLAIHRPGGAVYNEENWVVEVLPIEARYMKAVGGALGAGGIEVVAGSREGGRKDPAVYHFSHADGEWRGTRVGEVDFKTTEIELIDIDGDGWNDILVAGRRELVWLQNPGAHTDDPWRRHVLAEGVSEFAICDLDQDGDWEIVAATGRRSGMVARWLRRDLAVTDRWRSSPIGIAEGHGRPGVEGEKFAIKGVACGDLNKDGKVDLVFTASGNGHGIFSLSHDGDPASGRPWEIRYHVGWARGMKYDNVILADVQGDGYLDIVTSEEGKGIVSPGLGVIRLLNPHRPATAEHLAVRESLAPDITKVSSAQLLRSQ